MFRQCILRCPMHTPPFMGSCVCHLVTLHALLFSCNLHSPTVIIFLPFNIKWINLCLYQSLLILFQDGMVSHPGKTTNPFDIAFESDVDANDMVSLFLWFTIVLIITLVRNYVPYTVIYDLLYYLMGRQYLWPSQIYVNMNRGTKRKSQLH